MGVITALSVTAAASGEPKLYTTRPVTGVSKGEALSYVASHGLETLVYECKTKVQGRKGLENLPGDSVFVIGQVSGTPEKWDAITSVAKGGYAAECIRKVINKHTANFKNF
jgi:hypothetical protein